MLCAGLHEDLNRIRQKPPWYELEDIDGESDTAKAARFWDYNIKRNSSPVRAPPARSDTCAGADGCGFLQVGDLFAGQLMSQLVCSKCKRRSTCFDPCWDVSVQLPKGASQCTLQQCLDLFATPETLKGDDGIYCSRCKKMTAQQKVLRFSRLPRLLVVHLKRFEQVRSHHRRRLSSLWLLTARARARMCSTASCRRSSVFPWRRSGWRWTATLSEAAKSDTATGYVRRIPTFGARAFGLRLTPHARADGVTNHMGTLNGGHYTAFARNAGDNQWYSFNDERVNRIAGGRARYQPIRVRLINSFAGTAT